MKPIHSKKTISGGRKSYLILALCTKLFFFGSYGIANAQPVLFDFDNAPLHTSLPISINSGGITASLASTGQGFSIQDANVLGFTPQGFSGRIIYPNSVFLADLLIRFDQPLTDFSIMYACQELACDDAATMRVTAYMNGSLVGTNTRTATFPGTYPTDTLSFSFALGFDSVVVHYDSPPPTCQDYGVIFLADNMLVTALSTGIVSQEIPWNVSIFPNPISKTANIALFLKQPGYVRLAVYDINGRLVKLLVDGSLNNGEHLIYWDVDREDIESGIYFLKVTEISVSRTYKLIVLR